MEASKARVRGGRRSWRKEIVEREISESRIHERVKSCRRETLEARRVGQRQERSWRVMTLLSLEFLKKGSRRSGNSRRSESKT